MKNIWKYIKILITVVIVIFFIQYFFNNQEDFLLVLSTPLTYILPIFLLFSSLVFFDGLFIKIILKSFSKTLSILESFYISTISYLGNYFLPMRGGAVIRSVYLKKKFDFPYSHFVSTLYGYYIIVFLVNSLVALIALILIQLRFQVISIPLYIFFGGLFLTMLLLSIVKFPVEKIGKSKNKIVRKVVKIVKEILNGWNIIISDSKLFISLLILTLSRFIFSTILFYVQFKALDIDVKFLNVLLYNCLSGVSLLVSLTPGSLGIREGIFVITSDILGITNEQVMQLALLDRVTVVLTLVICFIILYLIQLLSKKNEPNQKGS
jgi:uncharacterized protein (TIRG00374 family)